jgi:serine protease Do
MRKAMTNSSSGLLTTSFAELVEEIRPSLVAIQAKRFGGGAGVILSEDGLILTNNHVLGRQTPLVTLWDDRQFEAEIISQDPQVDLALLQIEAEDLTPALLGPDNLRIGEMAFAIGHPWGQRNAVTAGIISHIGKAETQEDNRIIPIIRTDARLAPGNSGGPLVNAAGEVLGINTMIVGGDQGVAIPISVAKELMEKLNLNTPEKVM